MTGTGAGQTIKEEDFNLDISTRGATTPTAFVEMIAQKPLNMYEKKEKCPKSLKLHAKNHAKNIDGNDHLDGKSGVNHNKET